MEPSTNVDGDQQIAIARCRDDLASMEPSTNVDGDQQRHAAVPAGPDASMEPSTNVDGDSSMFEPALIVNGASMEPSTNVDGDQAAAGHQPPSVCRFNGAVDERRRRPFRPCRPAEHDTALQWSRRRTSTETLHAFDVASAAAPASMEPSTNVDGDRLE